MCSPIPGSMEMPNLPEHCLIATTVDDTVLPTDPRATWWGCWCAVGENCPTVADELFRLLFPRGEAGA